MPVNFPSAPSLNQTYTYNNVVWTWTGNRWEVQHNYDMQGVYFTYSNAAPASPRLGDRWLYSESLVELVYVYDGTSYQWVEVSSQAGAGAVRDLSNLITTSINASLVPASNVAYDLGSSSLRWRDLYLSGNTIDLGGTAIKSSANGVSFTSVANAAAAVPLTVSSLQIASATGNVVTLQATATGLQTVGTTGNVVATTPGGSSGQLQYNLNGAFAGAANVVYASTGQLLRGASSARTNWLGGGGAIGFQNEGLDAVSGSMGTVRGGVNGFPAYLIIGKTRSATVGGSDAVVNNDLIGTLDFQAADGTNMIRTASIGAAVDGTVSTGVVPGRLAIFTANAGVLTERVRIDSAGNFGLGVTPSAWRSTTRALQMGSTSSFQNFDNGGTIAVSMGNNFYWNSSDQGIYIQSKAASNYYQSGGQHVWQTAPSGTAGNAITFTQAMTLDASSNLGVGTTSPATRLHATQTSNGATVRPLMVDNGGNSGTCVAGISFANGGFVKSSINAAVLDNDFMTFCVGGSGNTERVRITSTGAVGIGTTTVAAGFLTQINGSLYIYKGNGLIKLDNGDGNGGAVQITGTDMRQGTDSNIPWWVYTNGNQRLHISASGLVGIGTTASSKLEVSGDVRISGTGGAIDGYSGGFLDYSSNIFKIRGQDSVNGGTIDFMTTPAGSGTASLRARISSGGDFVVGTTSASSARLRVQGNSLQGGNGTLYRFGDQYTYKFGEYNSQVGNTGRTLFAYAYDQANWYHHYLKLKIKRSYYYQSGYAEYMINCQNGTVTQVSNTDSGTTTSSITLSNNTVNANYRITTVSFVSPASYNSWDFELEFWGSMIPIAWTTTPSPGQIALN
jgi:hypothetical protein